MTLGMEKFGKVMESVGADLENYSAFVSIVPLFGYNFACMWNKLKYFKIMSQLRLFIETAIGFSTSLIFIRQMEYSRNNL